MSDAPYAVPTGDQWCSQKWEGKMEPLDEVHDWIDDKADELELSEHSELIKSWLRPCVYIKKHPISESKAPLGASRFGGSPDLPSDFVWPLGADGVPQYFMMQVNLDDFDTPRLDLGLPSSGLLTFFASDSETEPPTSVAIFEPDVPLRRTQPPANYVFHEATRPHRLEFLNGIMLPDEESCLNALFSDEEEDAYFEFRDHFSGDWMHDTDDRIGGYPDPCPIAPFWSFFETRAAEAGFRIPNRKFLRNNVSQRDREILFEIGGRVTLLGRIWWIVGRMHFVADRREVDQRHFERVQAYYDFT